MLFISFLLGGLFLQECKICLGQLKQIISKATIKSTLPKGLFMWAVKFVLKALNLLNTVISITTQKSTQTTLIQPQIYKFEG